MPIRNRNLGGLHRGTLFDTNLPASAIDEDIFTDQTLLEAGADGDLLLVLDVSEDPDAIKYITRSNMLSGYPSLTGSTDNTVVTVTGSDAMAGEANLTFDASTNILQIGASSNIEPRLDLLNDENSAQIGLANATDDMVTGSADGDLVINSVGDHNVIFAQNDTKAITLDTDGDVTFANNIDGGTWLGTTIAVAQGGTGATSLNNLITLTTHTTGNYVATVTGGTGIDSTAATSGEGTAHTLSVDLNEVGEVNIADGDYIAFMDATDSNATKKEAIADVASLFAGTGLTASSSVLNVDAAQTQITSVGTIGTGTWQGTAIASGYIAADAITAAKIADDAIGSEHIADDAVVTAAIADDAITSALIADDAVVAAAIADNAITMGTHTSGNYVATVTAGTGLTSTGATSGESIAHSLSVDASQTQITAVGTIATGTWAATDVAVAHGGTGASTASGGFDALSPMTAEGDILYGGSSGTVTKLAKGSDADVLTLASGVPSWATPTVGDITAVTAGNGLSGGGTSGGLSIALDLSELTDTAIAHGDYIVFTDTTDSNASVKGDLADVATLFAGTGLTASSSVIGVDASQTQITAVGTIGTGTWEGTTIAVAQGGTGATTLNNLITLGTHTTGNYLATLANATNGGTTIANSGSETAAVTVAMNLNDLSAGTMADGDSIAFIDADDSNATKKEALADLLDTIAGAAATTGLDRSGATLVVTDLHPVGVSGSANQLITDDGDGTVTSEGQLTFDGDVLAITGTGTAKANKDILTITNDVNAADMDGTETSILFNQWYYDGSSPAVADAGRISIGTEQDWTSTASTQDSYIAFETALNGTVAEKLRINSAGNLVPVADATYDVGTSGAQFKDGYFHGTLYADAIDFNGSAVTTTATLSTGISNTNVLVANAAIVDDDFLRVDGTSIEGRSASEVASDIGAATVGLSVAMAIAL